jgi:valyl-tRNA synthetase
LYHTGDIPWKDLMICGFVLAKKGEKISKSKSNGALDPVRLIADHSADALRYWTAGAKLGTDTFFSPDELNIPKRFITKLWNAARFAISHLEDVESTEKPRLLPIDRWILERVEETAAGAATHLRAYEIGSARHEIDELFWKDFCDNYIEIVKERLYDPELQGAEARKSGQYALYHALLGILKLYAIYVPHITEHIYQEFFRQHEASASIHTLLWEKPEAVDGKLLGFGEKIKEVMTDVRRYKSERNLSMRSEMDALTISAEGEYLGWLEQSRGDLQACTRAKEITILAIS